METNVEEEKYTLEQLIAQFFRDEGFMQRAIIQTETGVFENYQEVNYEYEARKLVDLIYSED